MNIAAIRNSALSSIDEKNNLPTWKGGAWPGGSSFSNSGVSGLGVSGQYLQGLINLISDGNITLIQNGQQITISGSNQNSQIIGSYVSGLGIANNLLTGAVILSGLGSISLSQNGQIIYISGNGGNSQISDYFGVTGIRISGDSISGAISFAQAGNVYLIQNGNNIIISGKESSSTGITTGVALGGVTGVGVSGNFTTGGINLKSAGSINLIQNGQDITISGNENSQNNTEPIILLASASGYYISLIGSGGQILNSGSLNPIFWSGIIRSNNLKWSNTEPSKIYISGAAGYYNLSANINLGINNVFDTYSWVRNGTEVLSSNNSSLANIYLSSNDYIEYCVNSYTGSYISGNGYTDIVRIPDTAVLDVKNEEFSPNNIPGLIRWYSASSGALNISGNQCSNGEEVHIWKNLASNPYIQGDLGSTQTFKSIYYTGSNFSTFPYLDFAGSGYYSGIYNFIQEGINNSLTIITKRNRKFTTGNANIYSTAVSPDYTSASKRVVILLPYSDKTSYIQLGNDISQMITSTNIPVFNSGQWDIIKICRKQSSADITINGKSYSSVSSNNWINFPNQTGFFAIGSYSDSTLGVNCESYITDFLMYNRDLSAGELSLIDQYLGKYEVSQTVNINPQLPFNNTGYLYNDGNGNISWKNQIINLSPLQIPKLIAWFSASSGILNSNNNICSNGEEIFKIKNIKNENDMIFRKNISSSGIKLFTGINEYPYPFIHISGDHSFTGIFNPSGYNIYRDYTFVGFSKKNNETGINYLFYTSGVNNSNTVNRIVAIPNHPDQTMYFDVGSTAYRLNSIGGSRNNDWNSHYFIKKDSNIKYLLNGNLINYSNNNAYPKIDSGTSIGIWFGFPGIITDNYFSDILFFGKDLNSNDINILEKYFNN